MLFRTLPRTASRLVFNRRSADRFVPIRNMSSTPEQINKSDAEWRAILSPEQVCQRFVKVSLLKSARQFRILRQKGTERPGTGEYDKHKEEGVYNCAGCGTALYKSTTKFNVSGDTASH